MDAFLQALASRSKFYRSRLSPADRQRYDVMLSGMQAFQKRIHLPRTSGVCSVDELVEFVKLDNPELFYVDFEQIRIVRCPLFTEMLFSYLYSLEETRRTGEKLAARIEEIFRPAGVPAMSLYDRELFLHDFLQTRIAYERKDSDYYKAHSVEGALLHGRAVCEGYAGAFKLLCDQAGISALVVSGTAAQTGKKENHAWNIVKLHGQCCHVDVTWDSTLSFDGEVNHSYFNLTDQEMGRNHIWNQTMMPVCNSTEYGFFQKNRLFFPDADGLTQYFVRHLRSGRRSFSVKTDPQTQSAKTVSRAFQAALLKCPQKIPASTYKIRYDETHGVAYIRI